MADFSGAYLNALMDGEDNVYMVLRGRLAELMAMIALEVYCNYITVERSGRPVFYACMTVQSTI